MMRLRILLTFMGLALLVTACNNSKKHDNPDTYEIEHKQEANVRQTQLLLKKELNKCSFADNPSPQDRVNCPTLTENTYQKVFDSVIPSCFGWFSNECFWIERIDRSRKEDVENAQEIELEASYAYEVIPVRIRNKDACFMNNESFGEALGWDSLTDTFGKQIDYNCDALLLKNVAGQVSSTNLGGAKKFFGHVIIAPISPNLAPAPTFAERVKLAWGHIHPSEAIPLQQSRYGNRTFNPQNWSEGYAHITNMTIKNVRYPMKKLDLMDLRTGQDFKFTTPHPMFAYGTLSLKFGYDFRSYNTANIGWPTPNFITEEEVQNYILNNNQESQERLSRGL